MMLIYWCSACRTLHPTDAVVIAWRADGPAAPLCPRCGGALEPRGLPDDPDDPLYGAPRCPLCRAELRAEARFCARCGAPAPSAHDSPTGPLAEPLPTPPAPPSITADLLVGQVRRRQRQRQIARALLLIADPPDPRGQPQPGDLPGDFHLWFDGGAARYETTFTDYRFADGTRARVAELLARIQIAFELPDGAHVTLEQSSAKPALADQLLAAVVEECRRLLESLHAEPALPGTGEPPSVCLIAEGDGPDAPVWRYDPRAGTLAPHSPAADDERPAGMYFAHARVRYTLASDGRSLSLSYTLGPRYGRGLVFALAERDDRLTLENPRVEWVA